MDSIFDMEKDLDSNNSYEMVIGLEIHIELNTQRKIFCGCSSSFGGEPNTHVCPVCLGMPGALPVLNHEVLKKAILTACALNSEISKECVFDRKNYFYPDNPQNYQITQFYHPVGTGGFLNVNGKKIRIHELHMEEDAGKLIHDETSKDTFIDHNRAGVPLVEIVTEPDMRDPDTVISFLEKLRITLIYLGVSDCRMNEGSMRVDVNLSVRKKGDEKRSDQHFPGNICGRDASYAGDVYGDFGTRTEMKNLNSFRAIKRAIINEAGRQIELIENGMTVERETRRWDDDKECSHVMRSKEETNDYRYFPEPDLMPFAISDELVKEICEKMPELPEAKKKRYSEEYKLPEKDIEILMGEPALVRIFEKTIYAADDTVSDFPKKVSNWLLGDTMRVAGERGLDTDDIRIDPVSLLQLIKLRSDNKINQTTAKKILEIIFDAGEYVDVDAYVTEHGLAVVNDTSIVNELADRVIRENPKAAEDYRNGKEKAVGFLVGQIMKHSKGQADPELAKQAVIQRILTE